MTFKKKQTFLSCVLVQGTLSKHLTGCCHLLVPGLGLEQILLGYPELVKF